MPYNGKTQASEHTSNHVSQAAFAPEAVSRRVKLRRLRDPRGHGGTARKHDSVRALNSPGALCAAGQRGARMAARRGRCTCRCEHRLTRRCGQQAHAVIMTKRMCAASQIHYCNTVRFCKGNLISMNHLCYRALSCVCTTDTHIAIAMIPKEANLRLALWIPDAQTGATRSTRCCLRCRRTGLATH